MRVHRKIHHNITINTGEKRREDYCDHVLSDEEISSLLNFNQN